MAHHTNQTAHGDVRHDLDRVIERRGTDSIKWSYYGDEALPLWVADMDFTSPQPVIDALRERVDHGVFGYGVEPPELRSVVGGRLQSLYDWKIEPDEIMFFPGTMVALNLLCRAVGENDDGVLIQTPIYPPFLAAPANSARRGEIVPLVRAERGYEIDFDAFERAITPRTRLFLLCNPQNPTGRVFTIAELERLAEICIRHDLIICSDEIHQDFVYQEHHHHPIASLGPEVAERTFTLLSPSKTYNIPGLHCSLAIASNPELRARVQAAGTGLLEFPVGLMGYLGCLAAYKDGDGWLSDILRYLQANRDFVVRYVRDNLPGITTFEPEGTYLAWLDCRDAGIQGDPSKFFLKNAKVALAQGRIFGDEGEKFVRLNFGCPRSILEEALERMRRALSMSQ